MFENIEKYRNLFRIIYSGEESLDNGLLYIRDNGANQMESVRVVMLELDIPLSEADEIVTNSIVWADNMERITELRKALEESLIEINKSKNS